MRCLAWRLLPGSVPGTGSRGLPGRTASTPPRPPRLHRSAARHLAGRRFAHALQVVTCASCRLGAKPARGPVEGCYLRATCFKFNAGFKGSRGNVTAHLSPGRRGLQVFHAGFEKSREYDSSLVTSRHLGDVGFKFHAGFKGSCGNATAVFYRGSTLNQITWRWGLPKTASGLKACSVWSIEQRKGKSAKVDAQVA